MSKITFKKSIIILVAVLMLALVAFTACSDPADFKPVVDKISGLEVVGNGGSAVKYGDYIYYVNGYQSNPDATNTYTNVVRLGSIVRIHIDDLNAIIDINDQDLKADQKTENIAEAVEEKVKLIVPCFYYTASTNASLSGLHIFNDRLYITTPNQEKTQQGAQRSYELVLRSYALDGSDEQQHYVFASTSYDIMLSEVNDQVYATYAVSSVDDEGATVYALHSLKVTPGSESVDTVIAENISSVNFDKANNVVFYLSESSAKIHQYNVGADKDVVLFDKVDNDDHKYTYTVSKVSDGYLYFTRKDGKTNGALDGLTTYYAKHDGTSLVTGIVHDATPSDTVVYAGAMAITTGEETLSPSNKKVYTVYSNTVTVTTENGKEVHTTVKTPLFTSLEAITLVKVEGGKLFYTVDGVTYTRDIANISVEGVALTNGFSETATAGWSAPDIIDNFTFTLTSEGTVKVTRFDATEKTNSADTLINLAITEVTKTEETAE